MRLFWTRGFNGTSLDELAAVTGMNRPSLYNAFGDKQAIYRRAFQRFADRMAEEVVSRLERRADISQALLDFYYAALDLYFDAPEPHGCFVFCTAAPEALSHPLIREDLQAVIQQADGMFERRLRRAATDGQLAEGTNVRALAQLAQALLHSLAIRARAGESRRGLRRFVRESVPCLLGSA